MFLEAETRGEVRASVDLACAVAAYWSFCLAGLLAGLRDSHFDIEAQEAFMRKLVDQHLRAIATPAAREARP